MAEQDTKHDELDEDFWILDDSDDETEALLHSPTDDDAPDSVGDAAGPQASSPAPAPAEEVASQPAHVNQSPTQSPASQPSPQRKPTSIVEMLTLGIVAASLLGAAAYFYHYFTSHNELITEAPYASNVPAQGEFASIASIDARWLKAPEGNDAKFYPSATITLDSANTQSGAIRVIFNGVEKNANGSFRAEGDSVTLTFSNGKWSNGSESITVTGTAGLGSTADFLGYRSRDDQRWTVNLLEAKDADSGVAAFSHLANAPIEPLTTEGQASAE